MFFLSKTVTKGSIESTMVLQQLNFYVTLLALNFLLTRAAVQAKKGKIYNLQIELENNQSLANKKTVSDNFRALGVAYFERDYTKAKTHYEKALEISKENSDEQATKVTLAIPYNLNPVVS